MQAATIRPRNSAAKETRLSPAMPLLVVAVGAVAVAVTVSVDLASLASLPMTKVGAWKREEVLEVLLEYKGAE
jgi:hypothetical protein